MKNQRGFTVIELIVVIAIIAVLSSIVLVNVVQYIAKGKNASIKGNMATLLTNGATFYEKNLNSFNGFANDNAVGCGLSSPVKLAIEKSGGVLSCQVNVDDASSWCGCASLIPASDTPEDGVFCVDSTGVKKSVVATCDLECDATGICR